MQSGVQEFRQALNTSFHRNSSNRALITPFEDIEHGGLKFTVYILPERSTWFGDLSAAKFNSELFCLSMLYTLVNKILRPLV